MLSYTVFRNKISGIMGFIFPDCFSFVRIPIPEHLALLFCYVSFIRIPFNMFKPYFSLTKSLKHDGGNEVPKRTSPPKEGDCRRVPSSPVLPPQGSRALLWGLRAVGVLRTKRSGRTSHRGWLVPLQRDALLALAHGFARHFLPVFAGTVNSQHAPGLMVPLCLTPNSKLASC